MCPDEQDVADSFVSPELPALPVKATVPGAHMGGLGYDAAIATNHGRVPLQPAVAVPAIEVRGLRPMC